MCCLIIPSLAVLVLSANQAEAFSNGLVAGACESMLAVHSPYQPQTSQSPYKVSVNTSSYRPGDQLTVTLEGTGNSSAFQGFLLQARAIGGSAPVGCFTFINSSLSQGLNCNNTPNSTISHRSGIEKTTLQATWEAPRNASPGDIQFWYSATFVKDYTSFWVKVNSPTIKMASSSVMPSLTSDKHTLLAVIGLLTCMSNIQ